MKILKFYNTNCVPCKMVTPLLDKLSKEFVIEIVPIHVQESNLTDKYQIKSVPTLILIDDDGNELNRQIGTTTYQSLKEFINV